MFITQDIFQKNCRIFVEICKYLYVTQLCKELGWLCPTYILESLEHVNQWIKNTL